MKSFLIFLALVPAAFGAAESGSNRPVIYASIPPQEWVLEQLGALKHADAHILLPAASGHVNYSPTPSQIRDLARAALFVRSGLPFEDRMWDRLHALNPTMTVINVPQSGDLHGDHAHHAGHGHDPHFWLDPQMMLAQARAIAQVLPTTIGMDERDVSANLARLNQRLQKLEDEIRARLAQSGRGSFWTFHGSWGHFAEHFGLEQYAVEFEGKESGVRTMIAIVSELEASGAEFIIVEPGLDRDRLSVLQNEAGLEFVGLNPMRRDYDQNLLDVAYAIADPRR